MKWQNLSKGVFTAVRKWKRLLKLEREYNETKAKAKQVISPDPNSLTQHIKRANIQAYYWVYCKDMQKCDPCLPGWKSEGETGTLIPLWCDRNQLPQSMNKCRRPSAHKKPNPNYKKTAVTDN